MKKTLERPGTTRLVPLAMIATSAALWAAPAAAFDISLGEWQGNWSTTLSVGSSWRAEGSDSELVHPGDGALVGITNGRGGSISDGGNLNYGNGDRFSTIGKFVTDVALSKGSMGGLLRAKAWYDQALEDEDVRFGNQANGYQRAPLSDRGFENLQRFSGVELLDAYVYNTFDIAGRPLQARLGRQVVNWGESLFIPGINQINPLDVPALRRAGTEIKEALLPVGMIYGNLGLGRGISLEAFYQFEWDNTPIDGCGGYWSITESIISSSLGGCPMVVAVGPNAPASLAVGAFVPAVQGRDADDGGQGGIALRIPVDALDTEYGFYAINIHSRTPIVSANSGSNSIAPGSPGAPNGLLNPLQLHVNAGLATQSATGFWEYPEDIQLYALTAATTLGGWSLGAELSHSPDTPAQRNGADLVQALLAGAGPLGPQAVALAPNSELSGYDRFDKTQFQINGVNLFSNVFAAQNLTLAGEVGAQFNSVPQGEDDIRYGRAFIFGFGSTPTLDTCAEGPRRNPQPDGCRNDGYVSDFAWGYRVRGQLEYAGVMGSAVSLFPNLFLSQDVEGYSLDGQFNEGRFTVGTGLRFDYLKRHKLDLNYVNYSNRANYDPLRDRDFYSVSYAYTF